LLASRAPSSSQWAGGFFAVLAFHVGLPALVIACVAMLGLVGGPKEPASYIEENVVHAEFVQLGKPPDPKKLPDRKVPRLTTAPDDKIAVSKEMDPPKPNKPDAGPPPDDAVDDVITRLGDRAQAFAEIAKEQEREGDPGGIEDGTATEAKAGDLYAGKLSSFLKRGWTVPTTLNDTKGLVTRINVEITRDLHVGAFAVTGSSGEALFDQSVLDRLNELKSQGTTLPEPPPEVAAQYLGATIGFNFRGSEAGR
jgi:hypothetical protein